MGKIFIQGLDEQANQKFNDLLSLIEEVGYTEITGLHLVAVLLEDREIISKLKYNKDTIEIIKDKVYEYIYDNYGCEENQEPVLFEPSNFSSTMDGIMESLSYAIGDSKAVNKYMLYNIAMDKNNKELLDILSSEGIRIDEMLIEEKNLGVETYKSIKGRENEIAEVLEILSRKNKSNPCLVGEPGVGKSAILKEVKSRIMQGKVPHSLDGTAVLEIDSYKIVSGTKYRGEMENKIEKLIASADGLDRVVFILDDISSILSSSENSNSAANSLKVLFDRPNIKILSSSNTKEYQRYISGNNSLDRVVQAVKIDEPDIETSIKMVKNSYKSYTQYHKIDIKTTLIEDMVKLSSRYINDIKLPDSAITVLDQTLARLSMKAKDKKKVNVSLEDIKETISKISRIPVKSLGIDEKARYLNIEDTLKNSVIGQDDAIREVARAIKRGKSGVRKGNRPIASFMFTGPTGVGKTELTKVLSKFMFGTKDNIIRLDMSEYMEKHSVSKLIGAPPGYVGYGEGGVLTNAIKRNPNSIILLDEIEKAHTDIYNLFLQVLDDGILTDANGEKFNFKHSVIIMTSNAGIKAIDNKKSIGFGAEARDIREEKKPIDKLSGVFKPEFLNRIDKIIEFNKLEKDSVYKITELLLKQVSDSLLEDKITVKFDRSIVEKIGDTGYSIEFGARNLRREVQDTVENYLADLILSDELRSGDSITIKYENELVYENSREVEYSA